VTVAKLFWLGGVLTLVMVAAVGSQPPGPPVFASADTCTACHNGMVTASGEDISFATAWRASMMANSARDPYWHAGVRREVMDHPESAAAIENECSRCHMPMAHVVAAQAGQQTPVFAHVAAFAGGERTPAADGASCTVCHQIAPDNFGKKESFTGHFTIAPAAPTGLRRAFGPYDVMPGRARLMSSGTGFSPETATHIQQSEMCATCHTLYTHALGPNGDVIGELPEQVPYLEWRHSAYVEERSCQSCHMKEVTGPAAIASVMGTPREAVSRHDFPGGNFFMLRMLNQFRDALAVDARPQELELAARKAVQQLQTEAATLTIDRLETSGGRLVADVTVTNLTGHKLPTAYPSRRVWIHLRATDTDGRVVFESGRPLATGAVDGNDNDADGSRFEPHHATIDRADQVQIYESIMGDRAGAVTTGLLSGVTYLKDNRLLPRGFDKATAPADVAVRGAASSDEDFAAGRDRVRYVIDLGNARAPVRVDAALYYQSIASRWAQNLRAYDAAETRRFLQFYEPMAAGSAVVLARDSRQ
jgi:hypothetical protein